MSVQTLGFMYTHYHFSIVKRIVSFPPPSLNWISDNVEEKNTYSFLENGNNHLFFMYWCNVYYSFFLLYV
uniref:Uncharacterized protein n=1 Tax=Octopus bimaculoides TaxID=37653 RepID=A0A0L8HD50_OCTBM